MSVAEQRYRAVLEVIAEGRTVGGAGRRRCSMPFARQMIMSPTYRNRSVVRVGTGD